MTGGARIELTKRQYGQQSLRSDGLFRARLSVADPGGCLRQPPASQQRPSASSLLLFPGEWKVEAAVRACRRYSQPCVTASPCFSAPLPPLRPPRSSLSAPNHRSAADAAWQIRNPPLHLRPGLKHRPVNALCRPQAAGGPKPPPHRPPPPLPAWNSQQAARHTQQSGPGS